METSVKIVRLWTSPRDARVLLLAMLEAKAQKRLRIGSVNLCPFSKGSAVGPRAPALQITADPAAELLIPRLLPHVGVPPDAQNLLQPFDARGFAQ